MSVECIDGYLWMTTQNKIFNFLPKTTTNFQSKTLINCIKELEINPCFLNKPVPGFLYCLQEKFSFVPEFPLTGFPLSLLLESETKTFFEQVTENVEITKQNIIESSQHVEIPPEISTEPLKHNVEIPIDYPEITTEPNFEIKTNKKKCKVESCFLSPSYGKVLHRPTHCARHGRQLGLFSVVSPWYCIICKGKAVCGNKFPTHCLRCGKEKQLKQLVGFKCVVCSKVARFGLETRTHCAEHGSRLGFKNLSRK